MLHLSLVPLSLSLLVAARLHHSRVPEDPYAFPKYRVSFLNGLPLLNDTAQRWLEHGLRGGELEFLDQPWQDPQWHDNAQKRIEGSDDRSIHAASSQDASYKLQHMRLGPKSSYLCLIPPPPEDAPVVEDDIPAEVATPVHSWSLLQPLSGTCLYHRQGWFTYSYCHNDQVRQFHELHNQHNPATGEYKPEEDPEWESYTLGRAPPTLEAGAELTTAEAAAAANLELARGAGSRYLVQRWGDGTYCDKTGRKREVEIQFHCSMTMTDTILFVKETQTCHYVLHISTPRLCGEPGFKSRIDREEERFIRCREIVNEDEYERVDRSLPAAGQPIKRHRPKNKVLPPPPVAVADSGKEGSSKKPADAHGELLRKALERLLARQDAAPGDSHVVVEQLEDGDEYLIEFVDVDLPDGGDGGELYADGKLHDRLYDLLLSAGYNPKGDQAGGGAEDAGEADDYDDVDEAEETPRTKKSREEL